MDDGVTDTPVNPRDKMVISIYIRPRSGARSVREETSSAAGIWRKQPSLSRKEFGLQHGASTADMNLVLDFAKKKRLEVVLKSARRRLVQVSGTASSLSKAFCIDLLHYKAGNEIYRSHEGPICLPNEIADVVEGVVGFDSRRMARRATTPVTATSPLTPLDVAKSYRFPKINKGAKRQTIAVLEFSGPAPRDPTCGFSQRDIDGYISYLNKATGSKLVSTKVRSVTVDTRAGSAGNVPGGNAKNLGPENNDIEVTLDVEVIVSVAQFMNVVVYFAPMTSQGWIDALSYILADTTNDPDVLSISWGWPELSSALLLDTKGPQEDWPFEWSRQEFNLITDRLRLAATIGMTVVVAAGDHGSDCLEQDGRAHVQYPASDPWVIACGGTVIKNLSPLAENTWNDNTVIDNVPVGGATGGGVSYLALRPAWQSKCNVPRSANEDGHQGRGIPDVAGNASPRSGYFIWLYGKSSRDLTFTSGTAIGQALGALAGTSAVAPLYAALIALINAALAERVGYINPILYELGGTDIFRGVNDGVSNSIRWKNRDGSVGGPSPGYVSHAGWNACTGWGSINGVALLKALRGRRSKIRAAKS